MLARSFAEADSRSTGTAGMRNFSASEIGSERKANMKCFPDDEGRQRVLLIAAWPARERV
jgi:hypothetical protein